MSSPFISQLTKAINKPDNFKTRKSLRIDFGSAGSTVIYQKGKVMCFRMYCNLLNRFVAVKCYIDTQGNKINYLDKIIAREVFLKYENLNKRLNNFIRSVLKKMTNDC